VSQDYNEAVQNPAVAFGDAELRAAVPVTNALGLPVPCSGNFADVYHLRHPSGSSWAVKCFTRPVADRQERYDAISRHLTRFHLPFTIDFSYLAEGVCVQGQWYPVVKMQWVEGLLLNQFVRENLSRPALLDSLIGLWARMARKLRESGSAHGDLQHGNVLLVPSSRTVGLTLKLIDYDGMFVPALADKPAGEVGHPAYQHPQRLREATYGVEIDRVPLLVIATALRCLAVAGQPLWDRYDNGDNLLFRGADLREPAQSPLFRELWQLSDPLAHVLVARLALACYDPIEEAPNVTALLAEDLLPVLTAEQKERAEALLGNVASTSTSVSGDDLTFDKRRRRRQRRGMPSGVVIAWAWVAFLTIALAVTLPIVWSMAPRGDSGKGEGTSDHPAASVKKRGTAGHPKTSPTTLREGEATPTDSGP
jgi:hypothetical protein